MNIKYMVIIIILLSFSSLSGQSFAKEKIKAMDAINKIPKCYVLSEFLTLYSKNQPYELGAFYVNFKTATDFTLAIAERDKADGKSVAEKVANVTKQSTAIPTVFNEFTVDYRKLVIKSIITDGFLPEKYSEFYDNIGCSIFEKIIKLEEYDIPLLKDDADESTLPILEGEKEKNQSKQSLSPASSNEGLNPQSVEVEKVSRSESDDWEYKDWTVAHQENSIMYDTQGNTTYGNEFGFINKSGHCDEDILWISIATYEEGIKEFEGKVATIHITINEKQFVLEVPLLHAGMITPSITTAVFTNSYAGERFIAALKTGEQVSVEIVSPEAMVNEFDIPTESFSLDGFIAARLKAQEFCEQLEK